MLVKTDGKTSVNVQPNETYIFIEILQVNANTKHIPKIPTIRLADIPKNIYFQGQQYVLGGIISYVGSLEIVNPNVIGHFKAYCHRINGKWEIYDSLSENKEDCSGTALVCPHVIFYRI